MTRRTILVPVDFSGFSDVALDRALAIARAVGADVRLVHVVDTRTLSLAPADLSGNFKDYLERVRAWAQGELRALAERRDPDGRTIRTIDVLDGKPEDKIVEAARMAGADLIVMGTHGRAGLDRLFLGSVAERVARLAPCDVLIAREPAA